MDFRHAGADGQPCRARPAVTAPGVLTGRHLIAGEWVAGAQTFRSSPADGAARAFSVGTPAHVGDGLRGRGSGVLVLFSTAPRCAGGLS